MKRYHVLYDPQSSIDMEDIFFWLADAVSLDFAERFNARLEDFCNGLEFAPFRSPVRDEIRPGLRMVTFENCVTVGFAVEDDQVRILRITYRGRDLPNAFEA